MTGTWLSPQDVQDNVKQRLSTIIWANRKLSKLQEHPGGEELIKDGLVQSLDPLLELRTPPPDSEYSMKEFGDKLNLNQNIVQGFSEHIFGEASNETRLWKHQCKVTELLNSEQNDKGIIMSTPTATGKTEAALLPIIDFIDKCDTEERRGIKAILIYPTRTLGTDQAKRLIRLLHCINTEGEERRSIKFGLMDGDTVPSGSANFHRPARGLMCPECNELLVYSGGETNDLECKKHGDIAPWCYATRKRIYRDKDGIDILVTGPEMIERRLGF